MCISSILSLRMDTHACRPQVTHLFTVLRTTSILSLRIPLACLASRAGTYRLCSRNSGALCIVSLAWAPLGTTGGVRGEGGGVRRYGGSERGVGWWVWRGDM